MSHDRLWTDSGLPILSAAQQAGLKDFWEAYEVHFDEINAEVLRLATEMPQFATILRNMSPEVMAEQGLKSREQMRRAVVDGDWAPLLAEQRTQGAAYAGMGVSFRDWFDLVGAFLRVIIPALVRSHHASPDRLTGAVLGTNDYIDIVMSVIGDEYLKTKERIIGHQQDAIRELSTPILTVRDRMLLLPLIGVLDTQRARLLTEHLLFAIRDQRAKVVVMDVTGVLAVDSKVANHLLQTVAAARLMGATMIVSGLSPQVAQALVTLGVDLAAINSVGDLQGGLEEGDRILAERAQRPARADAAPAS